MTEITGTPGNDTLQGTSGSDYLRGLGGNDTLVGNDGADTLDGGSGDDVADGGDGDDTLVDSEGGNDHLIGGAGNDRLQITRTDMGPAQLRFDGGDGNDTVLYSAFATGFGGILNQAINGDVLTIAAGAGNDLIELRRFESATIDAGSGNDMVTIDQSSNNAFITLGAGADVLEIQHSGYLQGNGTLQVTDFQAGAGGDRLYLTALGDGMPYDRFSTNPFSTGHLRLVQSGADTLLQIDEDGAVGGASFRTYLVLQGVQASTLTQDNFGFSLDGSAPQPRTLDGTTGDDRIIGHWGDDTINGLAGNDQLWGTAGNDLLNGGEGDDRLNGGFGNDTLDGGLGSDTLASHDGGNDVLLGGEGNDYLNVSHTRDSTPGDLVLDGGSGNDYINYFNFGNETDRLTIRGGDGNDSIWIQIHGGASVDAGAGDDVLYLDLLGGATTVTLGAGRDTLNLTQSHWATHDIAAAMIVTDFATGADGDRLDISAVLNRFVDPDALLGRNPYQMGVLQIVQDGADTLLQVDRTGGADGFVTFLRLTGVDAAALSAMNLGIGLPAVPVSGTAGADQFDGTGGVDFYHGGMGDDAIAGLDGDDILHGDGGNDVLRGGAGDDFLFGGVGADSLDGGAGNDIYWTDRADDLVFEAADGGMDQVISSASYYLYANIEDLRLQSGAGDLFGVGNALDNTITGNGGANLLLGGAGIDFLHGGGGVDSLFGEDGADQLFGDAGIDYLVGGAGNDGLFGGDDADALYGEDGDDYLEGGTSFHTDILVGGAGNDSLNGVSGQADPDYDLMDGGAGDDLYWVDTAADLTFEAAGGGIDTVYANVTVPNAGVYLWANVENLELLGTTAYGVGNELNNTLTGSASGNWLLGGAGNDLINGRGGDDVLFGEAGSDTFVFSAGTGADVIGDFTRGQDRIDLSSYGFSFAQLQAGFVQNGNVGAINLGNGDMIVLHNVTMSQLTAADFILAAAGEPASKAPPVMELPDLPASDITPPALIGTHGLSDDGLIRWGSEYGAGYGYAA